MRHEPGFLETHLAAGLVRASTMLVLGQTAFSALPLGATRMRGYNARPVQKSDAVHRFAHGESLAQKLARH